MAFALINKRSGKVRIGYFTLKEADRLCTQLSYANNPKFVNLRAQVKIMYPSKHCYAHSCR